MQMTTGMETVIILRRVKDGYGSICYTNLVPTNPQHPGKSKLWAHFAVALEAADVLNALQSCRKRIHLATVRRISHLLGNAKGQQGAAAPFEGKMPGAPA